MLTNKKETPSIEEIAEVLRRLPKDKLAYFLSLVDDLGKEPEEHESSGICPYCSGNHIQKNGSVRGLQRYYCCTCDRSFGDTTGSVRYKSKYSSETWAAYLEAFALKLPLREAARKCGISLSTSFFWRHKILNALSGEIRKNILEGIVQEDETYIQDNYKGNCFACKNLGIPLASDKTAAYKTNRVSTHRHGRGNATHTRGLSMQKICVPCAIDAKGKTFAKTAGKGMVQSEHLEYALLGHLAENVVLVTDKTRASTKFCESHEYPLVQLKAGPEARNGNNYNLQKINNLHSRLKSLLRPFKGVATKYLDNYLVWNAFEIEHPGINRLDLKDILQGFMSNIGKCATYIEVFSRPALPFPVQ